MDFFCKSLVNQFLDLLGFERLDMPDRTTSSLNTESMCDNPPSCNHDKEAFQNMITEAAENAEADMFPQDDYSTSAQISIPEEYHICLYCKKWTGNIQDARNSEDGIYGKCLLYQKEILSSNRKICDNFNPAYGRIPVTSSKIDFLKKISHI